MGDEEYHKKLRDLQKYVPFLENTIKRLKTESGKPREAQISKLQSLLVILTNTKKKLKYDALKKCEEVILKLYEKVEKKPTTDTMHKYMCRNPPDEKLPFTGRTTSPAVDNEVAFSVARQKLNKQSEMTPASPSPPLETPVVAPKPVVIPTEKIPTENTKSSETFFTPIVNNEFNTPQTPVYHNEPWSNYQEIVSPNHQTINWPPAAFNQPVNPVLNQQLNHFPIENPIVQPFFQPPNQTWPVANPEPLYLRRNDMNRPPLDPKYNVWKPQNLGRNHGGQNREIVDYSDTFGIDNSALLEEILPVSPPKPVPPPVIVKAPVEPPKKEEIVPVKPVVAKKEPIKITFPKPKVASPIATTLNKPPLSESDLQDLLSSSNSGGTSPLVNEDMDLDKLEELKAKLCKELAKSKKKDTTKSSSSKSSNSSTTSSQPPKPKSPRVIERVVKEQDNIFGNLLSSIDEQIMVKNKEHHKKPEKKDATVKTNETLKKDSKKHSSSKDHKKEDRSKDKDKDKHKDKSKDKEKKKDDPKDKTITKSDVSKLNDKVKSSYFKDDKKDELKAKTKDDAAKDDSKRESKHHKKEDSSSSKSKEDSKHKNKDSKSKDSKSNSSSKSKSEKSSSKEKEDKPRRSSITKEPQKVEEPKTVEPSKPTVEEPKTIDPAIANLDNLKFDDLTTVMPIVEKLMKDLKESVKEKKEQNLSKFGDSVREMQENLLKSCDSNHSIASDSSKDSKISQNDEKVPNSGRLSDKYPHKRKPSLDRQDPPKPDVPKPVEPPFLSPQSKPLTPEIHPLKLADPRLLRNTPNIMSPPLARSMSPEKNYQNPQFNQEGHPQIMFPFNTRQNQFSNQNIFQNDRPPSIESFSSGNMNVGNKTPMDPYSNMGNQTPMDPYSNMGNQTPMDPFLNDNYSDVGSMTPRDPFSSNFDVDMRDQNQGNMQFPNNFGNQNSDQFWNRPNQDQFMNCQNPDFQRFQNCGPNRFPRNQRHNFQNRQHFENMESSNFNTYDLSQMNPIDFYDNEGRNEERRPPSLLELDFNCQNQNQMEFQHQNQNSHEFHHQNQGSHDYNNQRSRDFSPHNNREFNNRPYRGRGINSNPRGTFRGRGNSRVQWVNPMIRDEQKSEDFQRKPLLGRFPNDHRFQNEDIPKDPRRSRFSSEEKPDRPRYPSEETKPEPRSRFSSEESKPDPRSRFSSEESKPDPRSRPSRFSTDDNKEEYGRKYNRFSYEREDPRKHSSSYNRKEETTEKDPKEALKNKEEIMSPLISLYSSETKTQVGKGYGIQKFKIPKLRKSIDENKEEKEVKKEVEKPKEIVETIKIEDTKEPEPEPEKKVEEINKTVSEEPKKVEEIVKVEEEKKTEIAEEVKIEANTSSTSKEESSGEGSSKTEADEKLDMFNKFMKHIFNTCDSTVLLQYLDKCGSSLPQAKTKRIRRIIESDSESEEDETKEEKQEEPLEHEEFKEPEQKTPEMKPPVEEEHVSEEEEQDVIESVGERIKNRRRKQLIYSSDSSPEKPLVINEESPVKAPPKKGKNVPKTRRKNALELLQEDIREMFISEGVLTATGKRMCRMMKEHQESGLYSEISPKKKDKDTIVTTTTDDDDDIPLARRKFGPKFTKKQQKPLEELKPEEPIKKLPLRKTRSSPRVLLEKINLPTSKSSSESSESEPEPEPTPEPEPETTKTRRTRRGGSIESVLEPVELETSKPAETTEPETAKTTDTETVKPVGKNNKRRGKKSRLVRQRKRNRIRAQRRAKKLQQEPEEPTAEPEPEEPTAESEPEILDVETEPEPEPEPAEQDKKKPLGKKKKNNWAHGVIRRGRRLRALDKRASPSITEISDQLSVGSVNDLNEEIEIEDDPIETTQEEDIVQNSDTEEYALLKIDIKPDVNYFLDNGAKFDCKLCDYKGKLIVPHYRTRHPESENMISRLSPEQSEKAKIESKLNKFDTITPYEEFIRGKKRRTTYVCRFCTLSFKQEFTSSFFDHICCHTGEYRYSCDSCSFYTGVKKTLSAHCHNQHPEMKRPLNIVPLWPSPPNFRLVFGYLCKACNFTQLLKSNLEKHIKVSHLGQNIEIIKISMSSKPVSLGDLDPPENEITAVEKEKTPEPVKEPDMTAFLEPDDISVREQLIEDERRKKMEEISSNITPRRSTLQFVDRLKSKLQSVLSNTDVFEEEEEEEEEPTIDIENHPIEDAVNEKVEEIPEPEEIIPEELTIKIASTCSLAGFDSSGNETELDDTQNSVEEEEPHVSDEEIEEPMDISNVELSLPIDSKQKGVLDTIQRLAAKLQSPKASLPPENVTDIEDFEVNSEDIPQISIKNENIPQTINVGAIEVIIKETEQLYICLAPNCNFTSLYKISFSKHCSDYHQKLTVNCDICQKEGLTLKPFTMTSLFVHLFDKHKQNSKTIDETESNQPPKIRLRRISGDLLSKPTPVKVENMVEPLLEALNQPIIFQALDEPLPQEPIKAPPLGFLQIKDVRTLTPEEEHNLQPNTTVQVTNMTSVTTVTTSTGKKILQTKKILVPVKELSKYIKKGSVTLKNVNNKKPIEKEILDSKKTKRIFIEMLRFPKIIDLYKCPIELCSYSTNNKLEFSTHFTNHRWCQITSCVYCHEGISSNNIVPHIDKFHAHCTYQCGFCFYRSINKNYLLIHQQVSHGFQYDSLQPNLYNNTLKYYPLKASPNICNINDFLVNSRQSMILPYQCQQSACSLKFLIADDFMVHLHVFHKKYFECALCENKNIFFMTASNLISHYVQHSIAVFQCRFCLYGATGLTNMYSHYARNHSSMDAICYFRQFKNKNNPYNSYDDIKEVDIETKMFCDKPVTTAIELENPPDLVPISNVCSSPTITTTVPSIDPIPDQNTSSSSTEDLKPVVENLQIQNDVQQIPKTSKVIDVIDLSDDNPKNTVREESLTHNELNEPLVTLKHRSVESKNAVENAVDPLSVEYDFENVNIDALNFSEIIPTATTEKSLDGIPTSTEKSDSDDNFDTLVTDLTGNELFKCGNRSCRYKTSKISDFKIHLFTCDIMGENLGYICLHCKETYNTVTELCEHIQIHGIRRFNCGLCDFKSALSRLMVKHMKTRHLVDYTKFEPVVATKKDMSKDEFIVRPISKKNKNNPEADPQEFLTVSPRKNSIFDSNKKLATPEKETQIEMSPQKITNNIFGPEDMDLLPRPPVYSSEIKCKLCNYNTKVRSNMQRHLQQHIDEKAVSETAPINPVPCLEKNEKMFDKMTNLAASSHYGRMGGKNLDKPDKNIKEKEGNYPGFVPASKRFVCGAENCNYLTHGDTMLRHHLTALHADETSYKCPHCQIDIPCDVDGLEIDQILFHIKMHDLHLYKCPNCDFFHYQKHKMEKHLADNHPETNKNYQIIRELDNSANLDDSRPSLPTSFVEQAPETTSEFKPWRCGFCNYKTTGRTDIQNHCATVHSIKSQFKCGLCNFRCSAKNNYSAHYKKNHPNLEINMISVYFKVTEEEEPKTSSQDDFQEKQSFDTTPLWVKNKSGVKHIRGILLEETKSISKRTPKIIEKLTELKTNLGEGSSKTVEEITKNLFSDVKAEKPEKETRKVAKELKSPDLAPKYPSHFGAPDGNSYVCPTCETFKTKSVKDFIGHLHAEMNYYRCACQLCDRRFVDISQAKIHWSEVHKSDGKEEKITPLTPDGKVENWVDNCIRYQHKKMKKPEETEDDLDSSVDTVILESTVKKTPKKNPTIDENLESDVVEEAKTPNKTKIPQTETQKTPEKQKIEPSPSKLKCEHCDFIAKTSQTYRKHIKRHMTFKPFKCNNCSFTTFSFTSVQQHHRAKHKELELSYTEEPQPEGPLIRPLKRKRTQNDVDSPVPAKILATDDIKQEKETVEQQHEVVEAVPTPEKQNALDLTVGKNDTETDKSEFDIIYVCIHCPRKSDDLEVIRLHFIGSHDKIPKDSFKYKKVTIDRNKKTHYKCNYCSWVGHPDGLKQHHLDNHNDKMWVCQKAVKFKCVNCQKVFLKIQTLKKHFGSIHPTKNLCFQTVLEDNENESLDTTEIIEEPLDVKPEVKVNKCDYCLDSFETSEQLLSHHNLLHSHLELKAKKADTQIVDESKKYKCPQCGHSSNSYPAMRDHLRSHNKPYCCTYCSNAFSYPNQLKSHHLKEHRILPLGEIKEQPEIKKLMDKLRENMLFLHPDGSYSPKNKPNLKKRGTPATNDEPPSKVFVVDSSSNLEDDENSSIKLVSSSETPQKINVARKSTSLPARPKNVAKKSTSNQPIKNEGYSFYGTKPCDINDYKNVMSEINIMGKVMPINVVAMSHVLNLFPSVVLTDFKKTQNPQNL